MCMTIAVEKSAVTEQIIWGAPTYEQARIGFDETHRAAYKVAEFNQTRMTATMPSGGRIIYRSLDDPDNVRGHSAHGLIIDEVQKAKASAYHEVLRPMLIDTGGWAWLIGTSNGHDWFWTERQNAKNDPESISWSVPTLGVAIVDGRLIRQPHPLENPHISFEEVEKLFQTTAAHIFRREIMSDDDAAPGDLVYDVWLDGYPERTDGNVTLEADFMPDGGEVLWFIDDGYVAETDRTTGMYTAASHPRVFLLCQLRGDGRLCVFDESLAARTQPDKHIQDVLDLGYPTPDYAVVDKSAAELMGRLHEMGIFTKKGPTSVDESIKEMRRWIGPDANGWRQVLVHPRCKHLRFEMASYRYGDNGKPVKEYDHTVDSLRYGIFRLRHTEKGD